jgi:Family 4 glycosyl hydrolase C-terminal domain
VATRIPTSTSLPSVDRPLQWLGLLLVGDEFPLVRTRQRDRDRALEPGRPAEPREIEVGLSRQNRHHVHQIGLMQQVKAVERHAIAAAITGSRAEALLAFALHPLVDSVSVARDLLTGYIDGIPEVAKVLPG